MADDKVRPGSSLEQSAYDTKRITADNLHEEYTFDTPTFENWAHCPNCRSEHVRILYCERDNVTMPSGKTVWLHCDSCQTDSPTQPGFPVKQENGSSESEKSIADRFMDIFR